MSNFWAVSSSVIGTSHKIRGEEKQDSINVETDEQGNLAFCLSDGAGSSQHSLLSSSITAKYFSEELSKLPGAILDHGIGPWINDYIIQIVINLRAKFYGEFQTYDLKDYHCTLVAGLIFDGNCLVAHIGDGAVITGTCLEEKSGLMINHALEHSEPENGEYKNETYFITEQNWLKHLRIKFIPNVDWIVAGTDGGIELLSHGERLSDEFLCELLTNLMSCEKSQREMALSGVMSSEIADVKTNDDKSLVVIASRRMEDASFLDWNESASSCTKFYPAPVERINTKTSNDEDGTNRSSLGAKNFNRVSPAAFWSSWIVMFFYKNPLIASITAISSLVLIYILILSDISPSSVNTTVSEVEQSDVQVPELQKEKGTIPESEFEHILENRSMGSGEIDFDENGAKKINEPAQLLDKNQNMEVNQQEIELRNGDTVKDDSFSQNELTNGDDVEQIDKSLNSP